MTRKGITERRGIVLPPPTLALPPCPPLKCVRQHPTLTPSQIPRPLLGPPPSPTPQHSPGDVGRHLRQRRGCWGGRHRHGGHSRRRSLLETNKHHPCQGQVEEQHRVKGEKLAAFWESRIRHERGRGCGRGEARSSVERVGEANASQTESNATRHKAKQSRQRAEAPQAAARRALVSYARMPSARALYNNHAVTTRAPWPGRVAHPQPPLRLPTAATVVAPRHARVASTQRLPQRGPLTT